MMFHHFGLLSTDAAASGRMLTGLGYDVSGPIEDTLQNVRAYFATHATLPSIEIISPTETPGPLTGLALRLKHGIYHLCFEVGNLPECIARLNSLGHVVQVSEAKPAVLFQNRLVAFYHVENLGLIEILETKSPLPSSVDPDVLLRSHKHE